MDLAESGGQIGQMFQDMDGQDPVEMAVSERQPFLAIADLSAHVWEALADFLGHIFAHLERDVVLLLLAGELLVFQMGAEAGPNFEGGDKVIRSVLDRVAMIEAVHQAEIPGQDFVPVAHEIIADRLLFRRERRNRFGPGAGVHCAFSHWGRGSSDWSTVNGRASGRLASNPTARSTINLGRRFTSS